MSDLIELAKSASESMYRDGQKRIPELIDALRYEIESQDKRIEELEAENYPVDAGAAILQHEALDRITYLEERERRHMDYIEKLEAEIYEHCVVSTQGHINLAKAKQRIESLEGRVQMRDALITGANEALTVAADRIESLDDKLQRIKQWCKAYPRTVFIEPTEEGWKRANEVLDAADDCPSLTAISGSNMRHVVEGIQAALTKEQT